MNNSPYRPACTICHKVSEVHPNLAALTQTIQTTNGTTVTTTTATTTALAARRGFGVNPRVMDPPVFTSVSQPGWQPENKKTTTSDAIVGPSYVPPEVFVTSPVGPERVNPITSVFGAVRSKFGNMKTPSWMSGWF